MAQAHIVNTGDSIEAGAHVRVRVSWRDRFRLLVRGVLYLDVKRRAHITGVSHHGARVTLGAVETLVWFKES